MGLRLRNFYFISVILIWTTGVIYDPFIPFFENYKGWFIMYSIPFFALLVAGAAVIVFLMFWVSVGAFLSIMSGKNEIKDLAQVVHAVAISLFSRKNMD